MLLENDQKAMNCHAQTNPHGSISFGKLTSMKIVDRNSVYAVGIAKHHDNKVMLQRDSFFGQFGSITSLRIIQNSCPVEVYIRYQDQKSAAAAVEWSRAQGMESDHGYHKYCIKFINNKPCRRFNCPNRHSWCSDANDIMERQTPDILSKPHTVLETAKKDVVKKQVPPRQKAAPSASPNDEALKLLQAQFGQLQFQYTTQNEFIQKVLMAQQQLMEENRALKQERTTYLQSGQPLSRSVSVAKEDHSVGSSKGRSPSLHFSPSSLSAYSTMPGTPKHSIRSVSGQSAESVNPLRCHSRYSLSSSVSSNLGPMDISDLNTSDLNTSDLNDGLNDNVDFFCGDILDAVIQADHKADYSTSPPPTFNY